MAMMITKFHSLIRSRLLWAGFLVIIVFTFVIWGTQMPGKEDRKANAAGLLDGKPVPNAEFRRAYFGTYMSVALNFGRPPDVTPEVDRELRRGAWRRMAALRQAQELGLSAGDDEVVATIQAHPGFSVEGRFSPPQYQGFIQNVLNRMGFSERQFEEHVREEIALQKLQFMVQQGLLVSPFEVNRAIQALSDTFHVDYVVLTEDQVASEVKVTEAEARTLFLKDPAAFTIPEKVSVRYVELPFAPYLEKAAATEEDAILYYDDHMTAYTRTNRVRIAEAPTGEVAAAEDDKAAWSNEVVQIPFDEVKTNILALLNLQTARDKATEAATELVIQLAPDREGQAPTFEEVAKKAGLKVHTAGPFMEADVLDKPAAGPNFNRAAFLLRKTPDEYFSDAVAGEDAAYVIALDERIAARVPAFEEVADEVMAVARAQAIRDAVQKKAQDLREAALVALQAGVSFGETAQSFGAQVEGVGPFSLTEGLEEHEYGAELIHAGLSHNQGEISELIPVKGGVLLAYVRERQAGDTTELASMTPQIVDSIRRQRGRTLFGDWQEYLLKKGGLEDYQASAPAPDEDMGDEDAVPEESDTNAPEESGAEPAAATD